MKLATLKKGGRDGTLVVVSRDLTRCVEVPDIARKLQDVIDHWNDLAPELEAVYLELNQGHLAHTQAFDPKACHAPLPRAYQWVDGSAYMNHVELVRKARGAEMPASMYTDPIVYQGGSDSFSGPCDDIIADPEWGIDFEAELAAIVDDVPLGASAEQAAGAIRLLMLVNDVSLRNLIPAELGKGFGFVQSKPSSAFSPVAITPDELGDAWGNTRVHLPLSVAYNGKAFGKPNAGIEATFDFSTLAAHVAKTRDLEAGTVVGTGTVSNKQGDLFGSSIDNGGVGYCCIVEVRMYETIEKGAPVTPYMQVGDSVRIEMLDAQGNSVFGAIEQTVRGLPKR